MEASTARRGLSLALVIAIAMGMAIAGGTGMVVAEEECIPEEGEVAGCEEDPGTLEDIGGNFVDALESLLLYAGLSAFLLGVIVWSPATPSSSMMVSARSWVFGGLVGVAISYALPTIIGLVQYLVEGGL